MVVRPFDEIFRDFVTDGVPSSGPHHPYKPDIRDSLNAIVRGAFPDNRVIKLNNANEGTANEIVVSASVDIPTAVYQVLYVLNVTQENTGPVTVSGAINRKLVTNTSEPIPAGYLKPGMAVLCIDTGSELRMLSYGDVESSVEDLVRQAEAALADAEQAKDQAQNAASDAVSQGNVPIYSTLASIASLEIPAGINAIRVNGRNAVGDGQGGLYVSSDNGSTDTGISGDGRTWWRVISDFVNVKWFGAKGDGISDDGAALQRALDAAELFNVVCIVPVGTYLTSSELKIASFCTLRGENKFKSIIKTMDGTSSLLHTITNKSNDRNPRTNYDEGIVIENITIDGNWQGRSFQTPYDWVNTGSAVCLSTVKDCHLKNVRAVNGGLHCIDIMASTYLDNGDIYAQPSGPSLDVLVEDCYAYLPFLDDGITVHNSGKVTVVRCTSIHPNNASIRLVGSTQNGIEFDEGSFDCLAVDCFVSGWISGYQAKGHSTTRPAIRIKFVRCTAKDTSQAFQIQHGVSTGQVPFAHSVLIKDCVVDGIVEHPSVGNSRVVLIGSYRNVTVDGLDVFSIGKGNFSISHITDTVSNVDAISWKNIRIHDTSELSSDDTGKLGLFHIYSSDFQDADVKIRNVVSLASQPVTLLRCSSSSVMLDIEGVKCRGNNSSIAMLEVQEVSKLRAINIQQSGYSSHLALLGYSAPNTVSPRFEVEFNKRMSITIDSGSPEGVLRAPPGTTCYSTASSGLYKKNVGSGITDTGWVYLGSNSI